MVGTCKCGRDEGRSAFAGSPVEIRFFPITYPVEIQFTENLFENRHQMTLPLDIIAQKVQQLFRN